MFLLGLEFGGTVYPWDSATVICLIVFGVVTIIIFVAVERYFSQYPIVPVHLYSNLSNFAIIVVDLFHGIVLTTNTYFLPLYCQSVLRAEPLLSGVLLLPFAFFMSVGTVGTGIYLKKTGRYINCIRLGFVFLVLCGALLRLTRFEILAKDHPISNHCWFRRRSRLPATFNCASEQCPRAGQCCSDSFVRSRAQCCQCNWCGSWFSGVRE